MVPLANPSNFSHCKCFSSRIIHRLEAFCHKTCDCIIISFTNSIEMNSILTSLEQVLSYDELPKSIVNRISVSNNAEC